MVAAELFRVFKLRMDFWTCNWLLRPLLSLFTETLGLLRVLNTNAADLSLSLKEVKVGTLGSSFWDWFTSF